MALSANATELLMKKPVPMESASVSIDQLIGKLADWRGKTLASVRKGILEADREIVEEWKWMGSPVWSRDGIIAVATVLKDKVNESALKNLVRDAVAYNQIKLKSKQSKGNRAKGRKKKR